MNLLPQFGFFELVLVAIVALIVVGPKDLPKLMRSAGRLVAKARSLAGEFTAAFDQMAREADMEELRKEIDELKKNNPIADAERAMSEAVAPIEKDLRDEAREINKAAATATTETKTDAAAGAGPDAAPDTIPETTSDEAGGAAKT
ncbi:Sec-independent protein translocase protein TatB [Marinicaulis aureus]|uniref:Sec-independent protein translocase protein TatB n=1 Tax=Hyphococcus aureus TaxID=2666033 RepID=A0ABW1L049_9PROT